MKNIPENCSYQVFENEMTQNFGRKKLKKIWKFFEYVSAIVHHTKCFYVY